MRSSSKGGATVHPMAKKACFACLFGGGQGGRRTRFRETIGDYGSSLRVQAVHPTMKSIFKCWQITRCLEMFFVVDGVASRRRINVGKFRTPGRSATWGSKQLQGGFTLIEAAVAIAVVAILAGIIVPLVVKNLQDSQMARAKNDVSVYAAAVASQLKDTGCRPGFAGGPGGATGAGYAVWGSAGTDPANAPMTAACTFSNLFAVPKTDLTAQTLFFGAAAVTSASEFSYRGPYIGGDVALKSDPWGSRYLIVGYNAEGQSGSGPIWIVCCGPDKGTEAKNVPTDANPDVVWDGTGMGEDDIVVRAN